eukprot:TRINITY_DN15488_c0_g1_i3.p1 TRINITY_DN15488_c0_g1~~TRINITY_DN15488_c0_g1_i3.p1  ORF type:complete len:162 (+),score=33.27 TRINITY_DN15488_c0_g1_i3:323-808(+)
MKIHYARERQTMSSQRFHLKSITFHPSRSLYQEKLKWANSLLPSLMLLHSGSPGMSNTEEMTQIRELEKKLEDLTSSSTRSKKGIEAHNMEELLLKKEEQIQNCVSDLERLDDYTKGLETKLDELQKLCTRLEASIGGLTCEACGAPVEDPDTQVEMVNDR